jgi:hypothetical protein
MPAPSQLRPARLDERARPGAAPSPRRLRELRWELARGRYRVRPELVAEAILSAPGPAERRG